MLSCVLSIPTSQDPPTQTQITGSLNMKTNSITLQKKSKPKPSLLNPDLFNKYDYWRWSWDTHQTNWSRIVYGEILYRWQLLDKRAEVLKLLHQPVNHDRIPGACPVCADGELLTNYFCSKCKKFLGYPCTICHLTVKGSCSFVLLFWDL